MADGHPLDRGPGITELEPNRVPTRSFAEIESSRETSRDRTDRSVWGDRHEARCYRRRPQTRRSAEILDDTSHTSVNRGAAKAAFLENPLDGVVVREVHRLELSHAALDRRFFQYFEHYGRQPSTPPSRLDDNCDFGVFVPRRLKASDRNRIAFHKSHQGEPPLVINLRQETKSLSVQSDRRIEEAVVERIGIGLSNFLGEQHYIARHNGSEVDETAVLESRRSLKLKRVAVGQPRMRLQWCSHGYLTPL